MGKSEIGTEKGSVEESGKAEKHDSQGLQVLELISQAR
jgi:hypothetical protein